MINWNIIINLGTSIAYSLSPFKTFLLKLLEILREISECTGFTISQVYDAPTRQVCVQTCSSVRRQMPHIILSLVTIISNGVISSFRRSLVSCLTKWV
ncbi:hypothetical protein TNCV_2276481 [Trichonephila clavipes]|nr:hypothetical protein TNCV_2276481 [Trichonephila clavipes]